MSGLLDGRPPTVRSFVVYTDDEELSAIEVALLALDHLTPEVRRRILTYLAARWRVEW